MIVVNTHSNHTGIASLYLRIQCELLDLTFSISLISVKELGYEVVLTNPCSVVRALHIYAHRPTQHAPVIQGVQVSGVG